MEGVMGMPQLKPARESEPQVDVILLSNPPHTEITTTMLLNVSNLASNDSGENGGGSNASTLIPNNCDEDFLSNTKSDVTSDIIHKTLSYSVMTNKSLNGETELGRDEENRTVELKVHVVKGMDVVDQPPPPRPDPEGQTETCVGHITQADDQLTTVDVTQNPAFLKLRAELRSAKEELLLKEKEVGRLSKIRDDVETELQDLTASLFVEAHRMVGEANEKRVSSEKSLTEATMKIEGLETEVSALKTLVLTSTPSQPNRHLHPQIENGSQRSCSKKLTFSMTKNKSPSGSNTSLSSSVVVGAGGLNSSEISNDSLPSIEQDSHDNFCVRGTECDNSCGFYEERNLDPTLRKQFLLWKMTPTLDRSESDFLNTLYTEDIDPCLEFPCRNPKLKEMVSEAIHSKTLFITPLKAEKNEYVRDCPLLNASQLLCKYHVRLAGIRGDDDDENQTGKEFCISQLARNRITAVCNLLNYLDYIKKGLVKSRCNDVYWEILQLRMRIFSARMGFSPD